MNEINEAVRDARRRIDAMFGLRDERRVAREKVAEWMMDNGFATGPGDTIDDLLDELAWQVEELRDSN